MANLKCKCGEELTVTPGAAEVVCPACNASYRVRVKTQRAATLPATGAAHTAPTELPAISTPPMPNTPLGDEAFEAGLPGIAGVDAADISYGQDKVASAPAAPKPRAAAAKTRPHSRSSGRRQEVAGEVDAPAAMPSKAPLAVAIVGVLMALSGIVLLAIGPSTPAATSIGANASKTDDSAAKKTELRAKLAAATDALAAEGRAQDKLKRDIVAETKLAEDIDWENKMLDSRKRAAQSNSALENIKVAQADAEEDRKLFQNRLQARVDGNNPAVLIAKVQKGVVIIRTDRGSGSGFIVEPSGVVVTNYHVVAGSSRVNVSMQVSNSTEQAEIKGGKVIAAAPSMDLALVQLPRATDDVGFNGEYPILDIREKETVIGESVFAIGAPGFSTGLLDYTVTTGIVANSGRTIDAMNVIQTTVPVNPGNSGGPLFDAGGMVIGVVSAKALDLQSVSFAIPMSSLQHFLNRRTAEGVAVANLQEWEKLHNPAMVLQSGPKEWRDKAGLVLTDACSKILPSHDGKAVYLVFERNGKVQEYLLAEQKLGRFYQAGFATNDAVMRSASGGIVMISAAKRKVVTVDSKTMTASSEAALRAPALALSYLGGQGELVVLMSPLAGTVGEAFLVDKGDPTGGVSGYELPPKLLPFHAASSAKYSAFLTLNEDRESISLRVYPNPACLKILDEWAAYRRKNHTLEDDLLQMRIGELTTKLDALEKKAELKLRGDDAEFGPLLFLDAERLIVGRHTYKLGQKPEQAMAFEANPLLKDEKLTAEQRRMYLRADMLQAVSADGKWAASQANIYNAATGKIAAKLPFVVRDPVFSKDGKTLFALDSGNQCLYRFVNWEKLLAK